MGNYEINNQGEALEINDSSRCPFTGGAIGFTTSTKRSNRDWWPNALDLKILRQNSNLRTLWVRNSITPKSSSRLT